ncbi:MAG: heme NO-binding domain-containing protein [Alphaproteobacteria bacterium]
MKGIVFNLLEQVVSARFGEETWDSLLETSGLSGAYTSLGSYSDSDLQSLVRNGAAALGTSPNELLRWFGREALPLLAQRFPEFFAAHKSTRSFILTTNSVIHAEVRKLYPGAMCPEFQFEHGTNGTLFLSYDSKRKLCALAHGLIEGAAGHFGESVTIEHLSCMHEGAQKCVLGIHLPVAAQ